MNLSCTLGGVRLRNPLVLASGILGSDADLLVRVARSGAGAVTTKSCGLEPRRGHNNPAVVEWEAGLINAVGLPNPGVVEEARIIREVRPRLAELGVPLIASIFGDTPEAFAQVAAGVTAAGADLLELNVSCPNVRSEFGEPFAVSKTGIRSVVRAVRAVTRTPVIVKLSPAVWDIVPLAAVCAEEGAAAVCAVNTLPGMVIDTESGAPVLFNREGGVSGPALKPVALRSVYRIAGEVGIPVVGTGGVSTGEDAVQMLSAGAIAVGVGSAFAYRGVDAIALILEELTRWMEKHDMDSLEQVRGRALRAQGPSIRPNPPPVPGAGR